MHSSTFVNSFVFREVSYDTYHESCFTTGSAHNYIMYLQKGRAEITAGGNVFALNEGDILYIPRGSVYSTKLWGEPEILFGSYAYHNCPGEVLKNRQMQKVNKTPEMDRLIKQVSESDGVDCRSIGVFYLFLAEMNESLIPSTHNKKKLLLETAMNCIRKSPDSDAPYIAKQCGISEAGLYNLFRDYAGTTPANFRMRVKLEMAYTYLTTTDIPIEEISNICGFSSSSYFRKNFKKVYEKSPGLVRKEVKPVMG